MEFMDIVLAVIILVFAMAGFWFGLIHTIGSLLGTIFSLYVASRYYDVVAGWIIGFTGWEGNATKVVVFIVSFFLIGRIVGILFWFLEKFINIITFFPFMKTFNRIFGFIFGAFEGLVVVGVAIYFIERFPLSLPFMEHLATSQIAPYASAVGAVLWPLVPDALELLKSTIDYVEGVVI